MYLIYLKSLKSSRKKRFCLLFAAFLIMTIGARGLAFTLNKIDKKNNNMRMERKYWKSRGEGDKRKDRNATNVGSFMINFLCFSSFFHFG